MISNKNFFNFINLRVKKIMPYTEKKIFFPYPAKKDKKDLIITKSTH